MKKIFILSFIYTHTQILLGYKKRGFGAGRWNGFGGKVNPGETIELAAKRELEEETSIIASRLEKRGVLTFVFIGDPVQLEVHVFRVIAYTGEPIETEEMRPEWYKIAEIPYKDMWDDDIFWLERALTGEKLYGKFTFDENDKMLSHTITAIESFSE